MKTNKMAVQEERRCPFIHLNNLSAAARKRAEKRIKKAAGALPGGAGVATDVETSAAETAAGEDDGWIWDQLEYEAWYEDTNEEYAYDAENGEYEYDDEAWANEDYEEVESDWQDGSW